MNPALKVSQAAAPAAEVSSFPTRDEEPKPAGPNDASVTTAAPAVAAQPSAESAVKKNWRPDWDCPNCRIRVWGSRAACMTCHFPNPHAAPTTVDDRLATLAKREAELLEKERLLHARAAAEHASGAAAEDLAKAVPPPPSWTLQDLSPQGFSIEEITDPEEIASFTALVVASATAYDNGSLPRGFAITRVCRVQNMRLWMQYGALRSLFALDAKPPLPRRPHTMAHLSLCAPSAAANRAGLVASLLSTAANEVYGFHGTKSEFVPIICRNGLDERVGSLSGLYGSGIYFADNFLKSHGYTLRDPKTKVHSMFISRILLGKMTEPTKTHMSNARRAPDGFDSVCGLSNHHELIVYDRRQTYPEFFMEYTVA